MSQEKKTFKHIPRPPYKKWSHFAVYKHYQAQYLHCDYTTEAGI